MSRPTPGKSARRFQRRFLCQTKSIALAIAPRLLSRSRRSVPTASGGNDRDNQLVEEFRSAKFPTPCAMNLEREPPRQTSTAAESSEPLREGRCSVATQFRLLRQPASTSK